MKPTTLKNGIQFLTPEQQRMVATPVSYRPTLDDWAGILDMTFKSVYWNARVLTELGLFGRDQHGTGSGEPSRYYPLRDRVGKLLDINNHKASILDTNKLDQRILHVCSTEDAMDSGVLERMIRPTFTLVDYLRQCERDYKEPLLEHTRVVLGNNRVVSGCQLSPVGYRYVSAWQQATAIMQPTIH